MFGTTQEKLLEALIRIQRHHCAYDSFQTHPHRKPPSFCDCKYGANKLDKNMGEEGNGCPELRSAVWILSAMTPEEYKNIAERGHVAIPNNSKKIKRVLKVLDEENE